jgi:hypothetical protein
LIAERQEHLMKFDRYFLFALAGLLGFMLVAGIFFTGLAHIVLTFFSPSQIEMVRVITIID